MSRPMSRPEQSTGVISGRRVARWVAVGAAVAMTTLVGCTEVARVVPQAIVWAPGSHTFGIPSGAPDTMGPGGQVIVCTDTEAVLYFQVSEGGSLSLTSVNGGPFGGGTIGTGPEPWLNPLRTSPERLIRFRPGVAASSTTLPVLATPLHGRVHRRRRCGSPSQHPPRSDGCPCRGFESLPAPTPIDLGTMGLLSRPAARRGGRRRCHRRPCRWRCGGRP